MIRTPDVLVFVTKKYLCKKDMKPEEFDVVKKFLVYENYLLCTESEKLLLRRSQSLKGSDWTLCSLEIHSKDDQTIHEISEAAYFHLSSLTTTRSLVTERYIVSLDGRIYTLDYIKDLDLKILHARLTREEVEDFRQPSFCDQEITNDSKYSIYELWKAVQKA